MNIKSVAVFCGSKYGNNKKFETDAKLLGNIIAEKNIRLIYGGGKRGLMGSVADGVIEKGGFVTGITPDMLNEFEQQHDTITELIVVEDMHVRKRLLYEKADAAIILPGGFGTLDELFEMLTWNQLSIHNKPIYVLNTAGFYNSLFKHIQTMTDEGFLYIPIDEAITIVDTPQEIFR